MAFVCPVTLPYWMLILGDFFAIVVVKQLYGGIGTNFLNPALAGRAALLACNRAMGGGCTIAARGANGAVAIAIGVEGDLYASTEATRSKAEKDVLKYCVEQNDECVQLRWATAPAGQFEVGANVGDNPSYYGPKGDPHRRWGAIAWSDAQSPDAARFAENVWIVGGRPSREGASARDWLRSKANSIEGGTSEVQLNIVAKRILGLPGA